MRRFFAVFCLLMMCLLCACAAQADGQTVAVDFLTEFTSGDNAAAYARLSEQVQAALPAGPFDTLMPQLTMLGGEFKELGEAQSASVDGTQTITVLLRFARLDFLATVAVDAQGEIVGFYVAPVEEATPDSSTAQPGILEEEISFGSDWALPGTLTYPENPGEQKLPAVVFVHGSGPNDRDETLGRAKPFRDIAHGLAAQGIVSLRYDKRTLVHGAALVEQGLAEFTVWEETIEDALLAAERLRQVEFIDPERIYLIGHSLGAMLAPRIEAQGSGFAGLILMAGTPRALWEISEDQNRLIIDAMPEAERPQYLTLIDAERAKAEALATMSREEALAAEPVFGIAALYQWDIMQHDALALAREAGVPMLILQGEADVQIYAAKDFLLWQEGLSNVSNVAFALYPELGHAFMKDEEAVVPKQVIDDIASFIKGR